MSLIDRKNVVLLGLGGREVSHPEHTGDTRPAAEVRRMLMKPRAGRRTECDYATDADGLLGQADVDAVIVASPTHEHGQIQNALKAGNRFSRKPLGSDLNEIDTHDGQAPTCRCSWIQSSFRSVFFQSRRRAGRAGRGAPDVARHLPRLAPPDDGIHQHIARNFS